MNFRFQNSNQLRESQDTAAQSYTQHATLRSQKFSAQYPGTFHGNAFLKLYLLLQCDVAFIRFKTTEGGVVGDRQSERKEDKRASGNYILLINSMGQNLISEVNSRSTSQLNMWSPFSRTCVPILHGLLGSYAP
jgi:hypothetical protein